MISRSTIQKVHDAADIMDVVGAFVKLKKRGANYLGNCPFHNEKTPSFTVSPTKGIYKCFGCGKAGNTITFIQEHEKMSYPEAITWLAKRYHIEIEETAQSKEAVENRQMEESLRIINTYAAQYFRDQLMESEEGQAIGLSYFKERGFRQEIIDLFQLGYCPENRDHLVKDALQKGYQKEILMKAGIVTERNGQLQAMYAGRVIFPIQNTTGKVIGFGARILKTNEKSPKYINTPENEIYFKSKTLYGIYQAKTSIHKLDECLLVEGYTDVISLYQAGVENVVASSGTSLTEEQLKLIKRFTNNLIILYDGDAAGVKAALRGLDMAIEQGLSVQVVMLPDNHDPDSFVQSLGAEAFREFIRTNKKDIILFKLEASLSEAKNDTLKKTALINDIAETLSKINRVEDFTKQQDYIRRCAQLLQIDEAGLITLVNKRIREKLVKQERFDKDEIELLEKQANPESNEPQPEISPLLQKDYAQEKGLIRILIEYGAKPYDDKLSIADFVRLKVGDADFVHQTWQHTYHVYFNHLDQTLQFPDTNFFTYHEEEAVRNNAIEALYFPYELSENWAKEHQIIVPSKEVIYVDDVNKTVTYFILRKIKATIQELFEELQHIDDKDLEEVLIIQTSYAELKRNERELLSPFSTVLVR